MLQEAVDALFDNGRRGKTIEKYLGKKYKVKASMGHVRDLPKSQMGVDVENDLNLNILPFVVKVPF